MADHYERLPQTKGFDKSKEVVNLILDRANLFVLNWVAIRDTSSVVDTDVCELRNVEEGLRPAIPVARVEGSPLTEESLLNDDGREPDPSHQNANSPLFTFTEL